MEKRQSKEKRLNERTKFWREKTEGGGGGEREVIRRKRRSLAYITRRRTKNILLQVGEKWTKTKKGGKWGRERDYWTRKKGLRRTAEDAADVMTMMSDDSGQMR